MPDLPANAPEDWPMRKSLMLIALLLAACGRQAGDPEPAMHPIDCALDGTGVFVARCRVEQAGDLVVVHRPDGGFRRLRLIDDQRDLIADDGAAPALTSRIADGRLQVALGHDRYRFPANIRRTNGPIQ